MSDDVSKDRIVKSITRLLEASGFLAEYQDPRTVEFMVNPDLSVYIEKLGEPVKYLGRMSRTNAHTIISSVAGFHGDVVNNDRRVCEGEFPLDGSRFEGLIPPLVEGPSFVIRKKAASIFTLEQYVQSGIMTEAQRELIVRAISMKRNILICGGTGSGKTTLINALIEEIVRCSPNGRVVIIEDTGEIQCSAENHVQMRSDSKTSMTDCLKATLRYRPDRILVGEVRGPECLDLLDAWNTGHPGGCATVHANSALAALNRIKSLATRNPHCPSDIENIIAETVNVVVCITRDGAGRKVREIIDVQGWDPARRIYHTKNIC